MIVLQTRPQRVEPPLSSSAYRVAGQLLLAGAPLAELAAFRAQPPHRDAPLATELRRQDGGDDLLVYRGPGWIGNRWRDVECRLSSAGYQITVPGAGSFLVRRDGETVLQAEADPKDDPQVAVETLLGPALILALALHGTWCLHASAVRFRESVVALVGESSSGKSTLASYLGRDGGPGWGRLADDILPVTAAPVGVDALPHFPQLKLPRGNQPSAGAPERLPLAAVYRLVEPTAGSAAAEVRPLPGGEAVLAIVRHTVAARLFGADLLSQHLSFCAGAAAQIPVRDLAYPRKWAALPQVRDLLVSDLEGLLRRPVSHAAVRPSTTTSEAADSPIAQIPFWVPAVAEGNHTRRLPCDIRS